MHKAFIAFTAPIVSLAAPAALAGPYVNVESTSDFNSDEYEQTVTDMHIGFEVGEENKFYIQACPTIVSELDDDAETRVSGRVGGDISSNENLGLYGEFSFRTEDDDDTSYQTKVGAKYSF